MGNSCATWQGGLTFEMMQDGPRFVIDGPEEFGGRNQGPTPKNLLLSALIGCTGMDVVSILDKMKVRDFGLRLTAEGELTDEHPRTFSSIRIIYRFTGMDLPEDKLEQAVSLSMEKYCGVAAMFTSTTELGYEIIIDEMDS